MVAGVIAQLQEAFGKEAPLTITRGKIHKYLGMTLDFSMPGKARILMIDYIKEMLKDMPPE